MNRFIKIVDGTPFLVEPVQMKEETNRKIVPFVLSFFFFFLLPHAINFSSCLGQTEKA